MSKTNEQLEGLYKMGLPSSHLQGLREVYQAGRADEQEAGAVVRQGLEDRLGDQDKAHAAALAAQAQEHEKIVKGLEADQAAAQAKAREEFKLQPDPAAALATGQPPADATGTGSGTIQS